MGYFGSSALSDIKFGSSAVSKVYHGANLMWQATTPPVFKFLTYTGNGASRSITGTGFYTNMVWIYENDSAVLQGTAWDWLRWTKKYTNLNYLGAEVADLQGLTSFDTDGFSLGTSTAVNQNGEGYRAFCWGGLGLAVTNNDGTIQTSISPGPDTGLNVFTYSGNGTANATVGHGMGATPEFVMIQQRTSGYNKRTQCHSSLISTGGQEWSIMLNSAVNTGSTQFIRGINASTITLSSDDAVNGSSPLTYIAFAFRSVPGVSKCGVATGDGSGTLSIDCGFMPQFLLIKDYNGTGNWLLCSPTGGTTGYVSYNTLNAQSNLTVSTTIQATSTGFSVDAGGVGNVSGSTSSIFYMAYA